eukprot:COSAG04_NODE_32134_length_253_cov_0.577922_1_plen_29_part_10
MYVGRYRPGEPASDTRAHRIRGYLVSSAR